MQSPIDLSASELQWSRSRQAKRTFELRAGETILATLSWSRGSRALAQWDARQYQFNREGWLRQRVLVRDASAGDAAEPLATYTQRGGVLALPDGRTFLWKKPKRLTNERIWADAAGDELIRFRPARRATTVAIAQPGSTRPEVPLLVLLGQYMLVLATQDAEAATAAATVVAISGT